MNTEFSPLFASNDGRTNLQLFVAMKDGKHAFSFVVDHDEYLSATSFLSKNPGAVLSDFDYVRTATMEEFKAILGVFDADVS